jgi:hypothetical protein
MTSARPTPFDLVFGESAATTFPDIRTALAGTAQDPRDRDAFLMLREVVSLVRDLRPDEGLGEEIDQLAALIHHSYLFWDAGLHTVAWREDRFAELIRLRPDETPLDIRSCVYAQFPEWRIWASVVPGERHEPLDGCFVYGCQDGMLRVLAVFGIYEDRPGFSVVEVAGPRPEVLARPDGSELFSPVLPGGPAAGIFSLVGEEELLELGWRAWATPSAIPMGAG